MAFRLKRASLTRLAVGAAVLAFPLLATGSAQAAIAGANPQTTTNRPDLVSATLSGNEVSYCFDKAVTPGTAGITAADFSIGGYRASNEVASSTNGPIGFPKVDQTNGNCVLTYFDSSANQDLNQYTIAGVAAGSVQASSSLQTNNADNTTLTGSTTHNGTTGLTVGPDLTGVVTDINSNTITYVEDQNVTGVTGVGGSTTAANFYYTDAAGNTCFGSASASSGNDVTVFFGPGACGPVTDAVRAGQVAGAFAAAADTAAFNTDDNVIVPGQTGLTARPNLLPTTTLESNGSAIDFTFDQPVSNAVAADFLAVLSNSTEVTGTSATINGDTVRVSFSVNGTSLSQINEYVVKADITAGAVQGQNGRDLFNAPASEPVGDNAGAFARGFTTAQDAFGVTFAANGVATVDMDQRGFADVGGIFGTPGAGFSLLDANGNFIAAGNNATFPTQGAGQQAVQVDFTPAQIAVAKSIEISGYPFGLSATETFLGEGNVQQILSPTVTASKLSRAHFKAHRISSKVRKAAARKRAGLLRKWKATDLKLARHHKHHRGHKHHRSHKA